MTPWKLKMENKRERLTPSVIKVGDGRGFVVNLTASANGAQRVQDLEAEGIDCAGIDVDPAQPTGTRLVVNPCHADSRPEPFSS